MGYKVVSLGDVIQLEDSKRQPLSSRERDDRKGSYPYYGAQGIVDYLDDYTYEGDYLLVAEDGENLRSRKQPIANEAHGRFRVNNHAHVITATKHCNLTYLKHLLNCMDIAAYVTGSTQPKLSQASLLNIKVDLPEIDKQNAVATFLHCLDAKIAANAKLNGYLEELGQALTCKYLDSCISNCLLSDILELGNGFAFKSGAYTENGRYKVLTIKNVQDGNVDCSSSSRLDELPIKMKEHCKLKPGDVVLSLTGNVGRVGIVAETSCLLNQRVAVLLPRDEHCLAGLYFIFRQQSFRSEMIGIAKGTAQANLSPVETLRLSIPYDESAFQELSAILRPVFDGILANKIESLKLAEFRNLLLPKLMSGEIDVSKIDLIQLNSHLA